MDIAGLQHYIDIGFMLLVCVACWKSLFGNAPQDLAQTTEHWKEELNALQGDLKNLVDEASNASKTLDRNLLRRQEELTRLFTQISSLLAENEPILEKLDASGIQATARQEPTIQPAADEEFPNSSWLNTGARSVQSAAPRPAEEPSPGQEATDERSLRLNRAVRQSLKDDIQVSAGRQQTRKADWRQQSAQTSPSENQPSSWEDFNPSLLDPTVYRIAKRLLKSGKEIHVVARKLELPLAEVRAMDNIIRQEELKERGTGEESAAGIRPTAEPVQHLISSTAEEETLTDSDIERAQALL